MVRGMNGFEDALTQWLIRLASVGHGMEHDVDPEGVAVR